MADERFRFLRQFILEQGQNPIADLLKFRIGTHEVQHGWEDVRLQISGLELIQLPNAADFLRRRHHIVAVGIDSYRGVAPDHIFRAVGQALRGNANIRAISLTRCCIGQAVMAELIRDLQTLPALQSVDLSYNALPPTEFTLFKASKVEVLSLVSTNGARFSHAVLLEAMRNDLFPYTALDLSNNWVHTAAAIELGGLLGCENGTRLRFLNLTEVYFTDADMFHLAAGLLTNKTLIGLDLSSNKQLSKAGHIMLIESFARNRETAIRWITLRDQFVDDEVLGAAWTWVRMTPNYTLTHFGISTRMTTQYAAQGLQTAQQMLERLLRQNVGGVVLLVISPDRSERRVMKVAWLLSGEEIVSLKCCKDTMVLHILAFVRELPCVDDLGCRTAYVKDDGLLLPERSIIDDSVTVSDMWPAYFADDD